MYGEAALEPRVPVSAMAAIVRDLLAGDRARLHDDRWLRQRAAMDGLGAHAYAALEALRARLLASGATLSIDVQIKNKTPRPAATRTERPISLKHYLTSYSSVWDVLSDVRGTW